MPPDIPKPQQPSLTAATPVVTTAVPAPISSSTTHAPTSAPRIPASTPTSKSLAAFESMLTTLASRPSPKNDRLAAVRAAKAAIQGGQATYSQPGPHPLPPRPSVAPVTGGSSKGGTGGGCAGQYK